MPRRESKSLPAVVKVTEVSARGVQVYQTDSPPGTLKMNGSPCSSVAPTLEPVTEPMGALPKSWAMSKLSLAGWDQAGVAERASSRTARPRNLWEQWELWGL